MNDIETKKRQFVDDILYRRIIVTLGIDYPDNYDEIVTFCYNDLNETADPNDGDVMNAFRRFLESKKIED